VKPSRNLLWFDGFAGLVSGLAVLSLQPLFLSLHRWPQVFILFHGFVSLGYAAYALNLARQRPRPVNLIQVLAGANMLWGLFCAAATVILWPQLSGWGVAHLLAESLIVGGLGLYERRYRARLV
jgi:hypothetical protein